MLLKTGQNWHNNSYLSADWGCPDGYFKLMENCFKAVNESKTFIDAQEHCETQEGARLARPQLDLDVRMQGNYVGKSGKQYTFFRFQLYLMGKEIYDGATGLDYYLLGYHFSETLPVSPDYSGAPEGNHEIRILPYEH